MQIRWLTKAADDVQGISEWLLRHAPHVADAILSDIVDAAQSLGEMPYKGRPATRGMRQLPLSDLHYLITYRISGESVQILRVRHMARKPLSN